MAQTILRRRLRTTITIGWLTGIGVAAILLARAGGGSFRSDLLMNLGVTVLGAVLTAIILQPVIERAQAPEVVVHTRFPHVAFLDAVSATTGTVKIMGAWPYGMDSPYRDVFLDVLRRATASRTRVQVLVLDPASDAARQRTSDMRAGDRPETTGATESICAVLLAFRGWTTTLSATAARHFELRVFSAIPPARLYLAGNKAICSFFGDSDNRDGSNVRHYETSVLGGLGYYVVDAFDRLWDSPELISLDEYWGLAVSVTWPDPDDLRRHGDRTVAYVVTDGDLFVSDQHLLFDVGRADVPVAIARPPVGFDGDRRSPLVLRAFDRERDSRAVSVVTAANRKYGDEQSVRRSFLEIVRAEPPS